MIDFYRIIDIDECSINSDSCDVNAVCNNTHGSHTQHENIDLRKINKCRQTRLHK